MLPDYIDKPWRSKSFADFFSRTMYYYNIIIINFFFYPSLDFTKKFPFNKKYKMIISLVWALVFGGLFAQAMKRIHLFYTRDFLEAFAYILITTLPYLIVLSLSITVSIFLHKKTLLKEENNNFTKMFLFIFLFGVINLLNYTRILGGFDGTLGFYLKVFTLGYY
jgi:hypothetical protein